MESVFSFSTRPMRVKISAGDAEQGCPGWPLRNFPLNLTQDAGHTPLNAWSPVLTLKRQPETANLVIGTRL